MTKGSGIFIATFSPDTPTVASDVLVNYTLSIQILGGSAASLAVAVSGPSGLSLAVSPSQITVGSGPGSTDVTVSIRPAASMAPGMYPVTVTATGAGAQYSSSSLAVKVVPFLVVTIEATFVPQFITVPVGSTVTFLRLNGPIGQNGHDDGTHNVDLNPGGIQVVSPNLAQYDSWTYTFTRVGSFGYVCDLHPINMVGTVKVTA